MADSGWQIACPPAISHQLSTISYRQGGTTHGLRRTHREALQCAGLQGGSGAGGAARKGAGGGAVGADSGQPPAVPVYVVRTAGREQELGKVYHRHWFTQAPLALCVCTVPAQAWLRVKFDSKCYADVDAAIVMDHMILAAAEAGLGTCWIADFNPAAAREVLNLPEGSNR